MQLARDLHKTKNELLGSMDADELSEWLAFSILLRREEEEELEKKEAEAEKSKQLLLQEKFKAIMGSKIDYGKKNKSGKKSPEGE